MRFEIDHNGLQPVITLGKNGGDAPNPAALYFQAQLTQGKTVVMINSDDKWEATAAPNGVVPANAVWQAVVAVPNSQNWDSVAEVLQKAHTSNAPSTNLRVRASLKKSDMLMRSLGRPNREQIVTSRPNDLTTLEAMDLNNANILAAQLERGAQGILQQFGSDSAKLVDSLYMMALSRPPTGKEKQISLEVLGAKPTPETVQDFLWTIFMLPEFQLIR